MAEEEDGPAVGLYWACAIIGDGLGRMWETTFEKIVEPGCKGIPARLPHMGLVGILLYLPDSGGTGFCQECANTEKFIFCFAVASLQRTIAAKMMHDG